MINKDFALSNSRVNFGLKTKSKSLVSGCCSSLIRVFTNSFVKISFSLVSLFVISSPLLMIGELMGHIIGVDGHSPP